MSSEACDGFTASESSEATTKINPKDEEDPGMEDAEKGAIVFFIISLTFRFSFLS